MKLEMEKDLIVKMAIAGGVGVVAIIVIVVALTLGSSDKKKEVNMPTSTVSDEQDEEIDNPDKETTVEYGRALAMVKAVSKDDSFMQVYDIENDITINLSISSAVVYEDEYGTPMVVEQFLPGYIVNVKYDKTSYEPEFVKVASQIRTIKNISSFVVDETLQTIQIGSEIFEYNDHLIAMNGDDELILSEISTADEIIVRANEKKIWSILIEKGHGYLVLNNHSAYVDGRLDVGNRLSFIITKEMKVPVTVGTHKVIITKEDMTPYSSTILIEEGEEYIIDLSEFAPQLSHVTFEVVQEGVIVYIDGEVLEDYRVGIDLPLGEYALKVEHPDYETWETILVVNDLEVVQVIDLADDPQMLHMSGPAGSELYIDGVKQGTLVDEEPLSVPISPGGHHLTLRKENYISWTQSILVEDNGEDLFYTVSELTEIATEPVTEVKTEAVTEPVTEAVTDSGDETPSEDTYGN